VAKTSMKKRSNADGSGTLDIVELRRQLGRVYGKPMASRNVLAKLLGASPGSVFNWEHGKPPSRVYIPKLENLAKRLSTGKITADTPVRRLAGADDVSLPGPGRRSSRIEGQVIPTYANMVSISGGSGGESLVRFGFALPGEGSRAVAEIVVSDEVLAKLVKLAGR
jgi:hypothetical protein